MLVGWSKSALKKSFFGGPAHLPKACSTEKTCFNNFISPGHFKWPDKPELIYI